VRPTTNAALWVVISLLACGSGESVIPRTPLASLVPLTDINPDPNVVEVQLVAGLSTTEYVPGVRAQVWAYRDGALAGSVGSVPGPMLQAQQGDLVIVHVRNELPEPTTVHWHGLRLPAEQDGSTAVQRAIRPGDSFDYRFAAIDAGTFWYHPHVNAAEQVEKGLYAPMIVSGGTPIDVAADRCLVLDDVKLRVDGHMEEQTTALDLTTGRQGNVLLVNGQQGKSLTIATGTRERWHLINAANGRYFNLSLPGHSFLVIGWDGGLVPIPYATDTLLIAPGERYDVLVTFDQPKAERLTLQTAFYDRGQVNPDPRSLDLLEVVYGPAGPVPLPLPTSWRVLNRLPTDGSTPKRTFSLAQQDSPGGPQFTINGQRWPFNTPVTVRQGDMEIWELQGTQDMDHPFHLHGMFFDVLSVGGIPATHFGWKDTVNVPKGSTVQLAVRYQPLGRWMFHCTIPEHAERGMMGDLLVE